MKKKESTIKKVLKSFVKVPAICKLCKKESNIIPGKDKVCKYCGKKDLESKDRPY